MITPRATRLVRTADLQAFRAAVVALACEGAPAEARDRLVVVPTRAAAAHLLRTIEDMEMTRTSHGGGPRAVILPDFVTPGELVRCLADRLPHLLRVASDAEREVLLGVAAREARDSGAEPPFTLRPGIVSEMLRFYDALRLNGKTIDAFERLALAMLEPGASYDRGAERLVRQTRFLVAAYRGFERRRAEVGLDEHALRDRLLAESGPRPYRHAVVAVTDRAFDPFGLLPAHWDVLARLPHLARLDLVVTDSVLAGALHERLHGRLPGIEEIRFEVAQPHAAPQMEVPPGGPLVHGARDREEEVAAFARRVKDAARAPLAPPLDRMALVVRQPLPYVYLAREVLRSGGVTCQMFDTLPLAAEPYAAAVDLVLSFVSSNFARGPAIALLGSPHFDFGSDAEPRRADGGREPRPDLGSEPVARIGRADLATLDRALGEAGYLGDADSLASLVSRWRAREPELPRANGLLVAADALLSIAHRLAPLRSHQPAAVHLASLREFLTRYERTPREEPVRVRQLRARAAVLATTDALRDAYERYDLTPVAFDDVAAMLRRWIEGQTFAPRTGERGVHVVDAESARFGTFDLVHIAGVVDGEWPDRPARNIFYSPAILRELGWPAEADRIDGARAAFGDLLRLPSSRLIVSAFALESDAVVSVSPFAEEVACAGLDTIERPLPSEPIFEHEALALARPTGEPLSAIAREWLRRRTAPSTLPDVRFRGFTAGHHPPAYSLSALERYQDCPFRFFAADVLRLQEPPDDESALSPRARGRFIHEAFQQFFQAWDGRAFGPLTPRRLDDAKALFEEVAAPLLARLPDADAALERTRLFGSAISIGIVDVVLGLEAVREGAVDERWLEYRLEGTFALGGTDGRRIPLKGVADRIDLLSGRRLRVIDYKSGSAPNPRRALQVAIYALCAQERLHDRTGAPWSVDEAFYIALSGKRAVVPIVRPHEHAADALAEARARTLAAVDAIDRGEFPPRPHDETICRSCAYAPVCRKDYVGD